MSTPAKIILSSALVMLIVVGIVIAKDTGSSYEPSNTQIPVAELLKNAYKFKGQSGVIDSRNFVFDHMAGENLAIFKTSPSVFAFGDQLAVRVEDNSPPEHLKYWRVYIDGVDDFKNGLGADISIPEVTFKGEYIEAAVTEAPEENTTPVPTRSDPPVLADGAAYSPIDSGEDPTSSPSEASQPPAPIERREADFHSNAPTLFSCRTPRQQILVDSAGNGKVRYRSWNAPKQSSEKPDIDLTGSSTLQGTGECSVAIYKFASGSVQYRVQEGLGCTDGSEPQESKGNLLVEMAGRQVGQYWCY